MHIHVFWFSVFLDLLYIVYHMCLDLPKLLRMRSHFV